MGCRQGRGLKFTLKTLQILDGATDEERVVRTDLEILGKFHQRLPAPFNGDDVCA
jgi:hypothetical protein